MTASLKVSLWLRKFDLLTLSASIISQRNTNVCKESAFEI